MRFESKQLARYEMSDNQLFEKGLSKRKQVLGADYVDANLASSDDFMMTFQRAVTELAWGYAWSRPGLDQKTRSILTLGILGGLGRFQELGIYTKAAIASGVTVDEIKEALVQITVYCGTPAGRQAFLAAHEALKSAKD
jgi:4-carboxymuconolactone decarboxylase